MKLQLISVLMIAASQSLAPQTGAEISARRVFVFFEEQTISSQLFQVQGTFYTIDNQTTVETCSAISSNGLANGSLDNRLWYVDIPASAKTSVFSIIEKESGNEWTSSRYAQLIEGCTFCFRTANYSLQEGTSWKGISISTAEFADYVLSRIDINSNSTTNGFMAYPELKTSFFDGLNDYTFERGNSISWFDESMEKMTTFSEKWSLIQSLYEAEPKNQDVLLWPFVLGALLLIASLIATLYLVKKRVIR